MHKDTLIYSISFKVTFIMISQNSKLKVTYGDFDMKRLKLLINIIFGIMLLFNRQKA